jgi:hypothetical protein
MIHKGSCHCGKIAFEVEGEVTGAITCNCSICTRKAAVLWAVPRQQMRLQADPGDLGRYAFNRHAIAHRFCTTCGIHTHGEDTSEQGETSVYINIRCLDGIDLASVPVQHFDGRSF